MGCILGKLESYLFSFRDRDGLFAVRVPALTHEAALDAFAAMSLAEKRASVVARLDGRERDHVGEMMARIGASLSRLRSRAGF